MMYLPNLILMSGLNFILPSDRAIKVSFETKISFGSIMFTKIYFSSSLYMDFVFEWLALLVTFVRIFIDFFLVY